MEGNNTSVNFDTAVFENAFQAALKTISRTIPIMGDQQPCMGQPDLTYTRCPEVDWVNSFWSGELWLAYMVTKDAAYLEAAREQLPYFAGRLNKPETLDHDLGFLYTLSVVADYKLTGDAQSREMGLKVAQLLAQRFNPKGQFIYAWNRWPGDGPAEERLKRGQIIIDCMENLGLLYWASQETGDTSYRDIAAAHARTAMRYQIREDGSTFHTYLFNPDNGEPVGPRTAQGYSDDSCWSRGQAWAIHGFTLSFAYTGQAEFLEAAQKLSDYALNQLAAASDYVPVWDYRLPADAPQFKDTSAAAITAAGLFFLAQELGNQGSEKAAYYWASAGEILNSLIGDYTTRDFPQAEGLLRHGAAHVIAGLSDNMLPYGDYFYLEALLRALGYTEFFW